MGGEISPGTSPCPGSPEAIWPEFNKIFDLGISAYENWRNGAGTDELQATVEKLAALLKAHFSYEESLLAKIGYESLNEHIDEHHLMLNDLEAMREQINERLFLSKAGTKPSGGSMLAAVLASAAIYPWI